LGGGSRRFGLWVGGLGRGLGFDWSWGVLFFWDFLVSGVFEVLGFGAGDCLV
jgi:hypothetical protein